MLANRDRARDSIHALSDQDLVELLSEEFSRRPNLRPVRDDVTALLRERRSALVDSHVAHRDGLRAAHERGTPAQVLVEIERQEALLEAEVRWLDTLLTRLDGDGLRWGPNDFDDTDRYIAQRKAAQQ